MVDIVASNHLPGVPEMPPGLSSSEVARKRHDHGTNILPEEKRSPPWLLWLRQMVHFFAIMLWVAGFLAVVAHMPKLGIAIFVIILINGTRSPP